MPNHPAQRVLSIMDRNTGAPKLLASLFEPWMWLLGEEAEAAVRGFLDRVPEPTLPEFQAEIDKLRDAAAAIRAICVDDVRTGEGQEEGRGPGRGACWRVYGCRGAGRRSGAGGVVGVAKSASLPEMSGTRA